MTQALALVMFGAALGGAARFLITHFSSELSHHHGFPYGTLIVNVVGSFAVGWILTWTADHSHDRWRLLAATGFCGGFTTFSAFAYETMGFAQAGQLWAMLANIVLNNLLAMSALAAGVWLHQKR